MDQPAHSPRIRPAVDPAALPPSAARRAQLLFILIVLPVVAVSLPAIFVTLIFGQRPKPKPAAQDISGLTAALQLSATRLLPTPSALVGEPIKLTCRPDRLAARADRVMKQAAAFGGRADEWLSASEGEKHFYVELPAGRAEVFRQSLVGDAPAAPSSPLPTAANATTTAKDQVEVIIRANNDD